MTDTNTFKSHLLSSLDQARLQLDPYRHWLIKDILPSDVAKAVITLPFAVPKIEDTKGKRETSNKIRTFISPEAADSFPCCRSLIQAFSDPDVAALLGHHIERDLEGSYLRIEYCQDAGGFWLEPHVDHPDKLLTLQIYLSDHPDAVKWGTDIVDSERKVVRSVESHFNSAFLFAPAKDTWHAFHKRPIDGIRRSLIINYVKDRWRARHEFATPDAPIRPARA